jgi:amino acid transporter
MVGIGIFATLGAATEATGSGILVAMLLGGSVALATGIRAAQLGVNNPTEGGAFTWARDFFSWYGILGCVGSTIAMPHIAVLAAWSTLALLTVTRFFLRRTLSRGK